MNKQDREYCIGVAADMYHDGASVSIIAEHFDVTQRTIRNWVQGTVRGANEAVESLGYIGSKNNIRVSGHTEFEPERRMLIIGDLHEPFSIDGAIEFAKKTYKEHKCNGVIFMGDVIDNHTVSYHETSTDSLGGSEELSLAIEKVRLWYEAFPEAVVIVGNHDRLITRKAQSGSIPKEWIKTYSEVLATPGWNFVTEYMQDDVKYIHGEGGKAAPRMRKDLMSTVQGHYHNDFYINYAVGQNFRIFGMQVGCLVDRESYGMAYARHYPKQAIGLGVILDNGRLPILVPAELHEGKIVN